MHEIMESQGVVEECELRLPSKARMDQVYSFQIDGWTHSLAKTLRKHMKSGLVTLNKSLILATVDGVDLLFEGTESEVLAKIRAVPVPKTPRSVAVKMAAQRLGVMVHMAEVIVKESEKHFANQSGSSRKTGSSKVFKYEPSEADLARVAACMKEILKDHKLGETIDAGRHYDEINRKIMQIMGVPDGIDWWIRRAVDMQPAKSLDFALFFLRPDVDESVLKEGYALWAAKSVMAA